ncbi:MAG: class D sortase [Ruminococcus sp.]
MEKKSGEKNRAIYIVTPFIVLLISMAVLIVAAIKPYNKLSVYLNLAFMDEFRNNPNNDDNGLVIPTPNEINTNYSGETSENGEVVRPNFGEQFAVLRCESADLTAPVYWGSDRELFKRGACQASYSKLPGLDGRAVISAHEDTFFNNLSKLKVGDEIIINTSYGEFTYTVSETIIFEKQNKKYVNPSDTSELILYTCKKDILGEADERIGVICTPKESKFYIGGTEE